MIIWVQSIENKTAKSGNSYDLAQCKDENGQDCKFSLFDTEMKNLFLNAKNNSQAIDLVTEAKGNFVNAVSGKLLDDFSGRYPTETPSEATTATTEPPKGKTPISPQEKGMFWKEVGENFRAKLFDKDDGANGSLLWRAYMTQMFTSLEIKFEKKGE